MKLTNLLATATILLASLSPTVAAKPRPFKPIDTTYKVNVDLDWKFFYCMNTDVNERLMHMDLLAKGHTQYAHLESGFKVLDEYIRQECQKLEPDANEIASLMDELNDLFKIPLELRNKSVFNHDYEYFILNPPE